MGNDRTHPSLPSQFTFFKDKERVLKQKRTLKESEAGKKVFINENCSKRIRETRRKLVPFQKDAKGKGKKVTMVYDH